MMPGYRQLPDGTWYNESANFVSAPLVDPMGGGYPKRAPAPPSFDQRRFRADAPAPEAQMIDGLAGNYGAMPGAWNLHMANGRNYPALGQEPIGFGKTALILGAIIGVATVTVWLQNRAEKSQKA